MEEMTLQPATSAQRIGPRAFGRGPLACGGAWRWAGWAVRLAGRYGARGEVWERLSATLRTVGPAGAVGSQVQIWHTSLHQTQQWPLTLTLRLALQTPAESRWAGLGWPRAPGVLLASEQPAGAGPQWATPMTVRQAGAPPAPPLVAVPQTTLRTVLAQPAAALASPGAPPQPGAPPPHPGAPPAALALPPVPRVVQRPAPAAAGSGAAQAAHAPAAPSGLRYWGEPPPAAALAVNVEQLTDQVIRAIDQRVVAARERLGKS